MYSNPISQENISVVVISYEFVQCESYGNIKQILTRPLPSPPKKQTSIYENLMEKLFYKVVISCEFAQCESYKIKVSMKVQL